MKSIEPLGNARSVQCPKCAHTQSVEETGTIKAAIYVLLLPFIWVAMLLLSTVLQIELATWFGRKVKCSNCGEAFEPKKSNQAL